MPTLLGKLSFRDNIRPSDVTDDVRNELVRREVKSLCILLVVTVFLAIGLAWSIWFGYSMGDPMAGGPRWSPSQVYPFQAVVVALVLTGMVGTSLRRIRFIRSACVTKGVVLHT